MANVCIQLSGGYKLALVSQIPSDLLYVNPINTGGKSLN